MIAGRLHRLHRERDHARKRVDQCRAELARLESYYDPTKEHDMIRICKLQRDLRVAELDAAHASLQLEDELRAEGITL